MVSPFMPEAAKVAAIRDLLPATGAGIYLDAGTAGPMSTETQRAMDELAARELATGRAHADIVPETLERLAEARASVAAVLVADPGDIALTHSTRDGMRLAVACLPWRAGDRVITTRHEHPGVLQPLAAVRDRLGVELEMVDIGAGGDDERTLDAFRAALERPARAVVVSHVTWMTGAVLPVGRLASLARSAGAATLVDGAQAVGAIPVTVEDLGVDAYATSAHKWLLGPEGMGALWVHRELAAVSMPPSAGRSTGPPGKPEDAAVRGAAGSLETTRFHRPSVVGFARSCGWLSMSVGLPWALERAGRLARAAADRLAAIPGVEVVTARTRMGTLVTFRITGWDPLAAAAELGARAFAIVKALPSIEALRISVGFWTTEDELDRFAEAVELLAAHAPDKLPPLRRLTVLGSDDRPLG